MTMTESETISYTECKIEQDVNVYQTINTLENPELFLKLVAGDINSFTCSECSHAANIQLPLLFNDYRVGVRIHYYGASLK